MDTGPIDRQQWSTFIDAFSRSHNGWSASVDICEAGAPARVEVDDSAFRGATVEKRDSRDTLVLTFGYEPEEHFAHIIHDPRTIMASEADDRSAASLVIESSDGGKCILALWNPLRESIL